MTTPPEAAPMHEDVTQADRDRVKAISERLLSAMRRVAREDGWALGVHGSMSRDLDLIAVPWVENAVTEAAFVEAMRATVAREIGGTSFIGAGEDGRTLGVKEKPNGRRCWTIHSTSEDLVENHIGAHPYIDLAVLDNRSALDARPNAEGDKAEIERLRGLLIDPRSPPWEDARAVLVAELRKEAFHLQADSVEEAHAVEIQSHIALNLVAQAARAAPQDGYATAFYEIADLLGIPARAASPAEVWRDEMRPKLEALVAPPGTGDEVERVAKAIEEASVGHSINLTKMVDGEAEYTAVVGDQEPRIFPSYSDASDYVETFRRHSRARAALAAMREGVDRRMVEQLRGALRRLERANDAVAAGTTRERYLTDLADVQPALLELDDARLAARAALARKGAQS